MQEFELIKTMIEVILVPSFGWYIKNMASDLKEVSKSQTEQSKELAVLRVALIGLDGKNGMRSELANLKRKQDNSEHSPKHD